MMTQQRVFEGLPVRSANKSFDCENCTISQLDQRLRLLMTLVSRVSQLPQVVVKQVPMMMPSGDLVLIPGPWSLEMSSSRSSSLTDGDEKTVPALAGEEEEESSSKRDRFVVRNEFGHARLHQLLELIDAHCEGNDDADSLNPRAVEVGGHCVLPPDIFDECVDKGWGSKHPFAGRYHPITGTVVPDTTLLYHSPRDDYELEAIWKVILKSYEWAKSSEGCSSK